MRSIPHVICLAQVFGMVEVYAASTDLTPRIGVTGIYSDNIDLVDNGAKEEFITQLTPGFSAGVKGGRISGNMDYQMQGLLYARDERREVFHQLDGTGTAELVEETLLVDVDANVFQSVVNPRDTIARDNVNNTDNRTDVVTAGISPYWRYSFPDAVEALARYRYGIVNYGETDVNDDSNLVDSDIQEVFLSLGNIRERSKVWTWRLGYEATRVDFDDGLRNEFRSAVASMGYRITRKLQLVVDGGDDDNDFESEGQVDTSGFYWNSGLNWDPNSKNHVELGFGNRYGGDVYNFLWVRRARYFTLDASYAQTLATDASVVSRDQVAVDSGDVNRFLSDTTTFERKLFSLNSTIEWSKNTFNLTFTDERRENQDAAGDEDRLTRLSGSWRWSISSLSSIMLALIADRQKFGDTNQEDDLGLATLSLTRKFGIKTEGTLRYSHSRLDSGGDTEDYKENRVWLSFVRSF